MIETIYIKNFKSARQLVIPTKPLTVLTGLNGSGKSTTLQSIGLLRQSLIQDESNKEFLHQSLGKIHFKGSLLQLGTVGDIFSQNAQDSIFEIGIKSTTEPTPWMFSGVVETKDYDSYSIPTNASKTHDLLETDDCKIHPTQLEFQKKKFQFLQADRLTPRTHYDRGNATEFLGSGGQYTPDFLTANGDSLDVSLHRLCPAIIDGIDHRIIERITRTTKLNDQANLWMQHISPGIRIEVENIELTDLVTLGYSYASTRLARGSGRRRPTNVGFGITYSLPILVACLSAPSESLLLIENPEAHLHPKGQFALGELLARTAADGVQIFVETHSDHIMNGIRFAVRKEVIKNSAVYFHHFSRDAGTGESSFESPYINSNGSLSDWPEGFFDEWEKSIERLLF